VLRSSFVVVAEDLAANGRIESGIPCVPCESSMILSQPAETKKVGCDNRIRKNALRLGRRGQASSAYSG